LKHLNRLNVHLYVTPICNLHCKHCYYDAWPLDQRPNKLLTIEEMVFIIRTLSNNFDAAFDIEGGEFFLRDDINELFAQLPQQYLKNITITTNGTLAKNILSRDIKYLDEFRISVEGHSDELQRDIRGISLHPVLNTGLGLISENVSVTLRITLHKKNFSALIDMLEYFTSLGFKNFSFYEFQSSGRGHSCEREYGLDQSEIEKVLQLLVENEPLSEINILKLNFNATREDLVRKYQVLLEDRNYLLLDISGIPSLTINYDGDLGVCPWNIGHDHVGKFQKASFLDDVNRYFDKGILSHECAHCSAIRVLLNNKLG